MHIWTLARTLAAPLLSLLFLLLASGLFTTTLSLRLDYEGFAKSSVGLIMAALYGGVCLGSLFLARLVKTWGHKRTLLFFSFALGALVLGQLFWIDVYYWAFLRMLGGICTAGIFIVVESWLLLQSPPAYRGSALALYLITLYAGLSLGQFLVDISEPHTNIPFYLTAGLCALASVPLFLQKKISAFSEEEEKPLSLGALFRASPFGFLGSAISGMVLSAIYALLPLYAKEIGLSVSQIGTLMAMLIFGGLSFQWPMAYWGDRGGRKKALNSACFFTAILGLCLAYLEASSYGFLLALAWCFGGFSFTIYPLSMAYICSKVSQSQIVAATGACVLSYSLGAVAGPLLAPFAIYFFGKEGLFYFFASLTVGLGVWGLKREKIAAPALQPIPVEEETAKEKTEADS